jgi:hypothetical protein
MTGSGAEAEQRKAFRLFRSLRVDMELGGRLRDKIQGSRFSRRDESTKTFSFRRDEIAVHGVNSVFLVLGILTSAP